MIERALLRVDAKAEGLAVAVGGWCPHHDARGNIVIGKSRWFSLSLTEATAPWAFVRGTPARAISTLELLAATIGLVVLTPDELSEPGAAGTVMVTGFTDSFVSSSVASRGLTTSFPLCVVAMELAAQLEHRSAELFLEWSPRTMNQESDALADGRTNGFNPALRVPVGLSRMQWLVLDRLMAAGVPFQKQAQMLKEQGSCTQARVTVRRAKTQRLRTRVPW